MSTTARISFVIVSVLLASIPCAVVQALSGAKSQPNPQPPGVDLYGDPFPEGAVARLGTAKWRHRIGVDELVFSHDGTMLASAGYGEVIIWDFVGHRRHRFLIHAGNWCLRFSKDDKFLFTNSNHVIDTANGQASELPKTRDSALQILAFAPDGKTAAVAMIHPDAPPFPPHVEIWDVAQGKVVRILEGHTDLLSAVDFAADGLTLASSSMDGTVRIWDVATGKEQRLLDCHEKGAGAVTYSPSGQLVAAVGAGGYLKVWNVKTGALMYQIKNAWAAGSKLAFSPDGKLLAGTVEFGSVCVWDADTGKELRRWQAHSFDVCALTFSSDGKVLASAGSQETAIRRWEVLTGTELEAIPAHFGAVQSMTFSPDGKRLMSVGIERRVLEWDLSSSRETGQKCHSPIGTHSNNRIRTCEISPTGKYLALEKNRTYDKAAIHGVGLWDTVSGTELRAISAGTMSIQGIRFSTDEKLVAAGGRNLLSLWDLDTGKETDLLRGRQLTIGTIALSSDSRFLASIDFESDLVTKRNRRTIRLWNLLQRKEARAWTKEVAVGKQTGTTLGLSPDAKKIAFGEIGVVRVCATDTGKELLQLSHGVNREHILALAFSPSGRILACAATQSPDIGPGTSDAEPVASIHLWELSSGKEFRRIPIHANFVSLIAFSPDGRHLAAALSNSTIIIWDLTRSTAQLGIE